MRPDVEAIKARWNGVSYFGELAMPDILRDMGDLLCWIQELEADTKQLCAAIDQLAVMVGLGRDE